MILSVSVLEGVRVSLSGPGRTREKAMALFVTMLVLVLLFTAGLTLWFRRKGWRPVAALLMLLPMAVCGYLTLSVGTSDTITETVVLVEFDSTGTREIGRESLPNSEILGEVNTRAVAFVAGMGVLFILGLLAWVTMFLAWLLRRVRTRTPEGSGIGVNVCLPAWQR